jgi:hypothetical protein
MPGGKVSHEKKGKARVYRGERWSRSWLWHKVKKISR